MSCENWRLEKIVAWGVIRMQACVSVPNPKTARAIPAEDRRIAPIQHRFLPVISVRIV